MPSRALQRRADAADEHLDHLILALDNIAVVYRGVSELYAVLGAVLGVIEYLSRIEQRFCRNTALVQAYTAERSLFDNEGLESPMCGALRRIISGGTSAENYQIIHLRLRPFSLSHQKPGSSRDRDRARAGSSPPARRRERGGRR